MFLDAWGSVFLFRILALFLSLLILAGSVFATALGISRMRKGRRITRCPSRGSVGARRSLRYPPLGLRAGRSPSPSYAERELLSSGNRATDGARVVPRPRAIGLGKDCADSGAIYRLQIALPDGTMIAGVSDDIS